MNSKPLSIDSQYNTSTNSIPQNLNTQDSVAQTNPSNIESNTLSTVQQNTDAFIFNPDNPQEYFDYSKQRQRANTRGDILYRHCSKHRK